MMDEEITEKWNQLKQKLDKLEEEKTELIRQQRYEEAALWRDKGKVVRKEMEELRA